MIAGGGQTGAMLQLDRVLLGPAVGDREYGALAASANVSLGDPQLALLEAFILAARRSVENVEDQYAAFFPIGARSGPLWALALTKVTKFAAGGFVVYCDALILPRPFLDRIGWAVHRLVWQWPQTPTPESRRVPMIAVDGRVFEAATPIPPDVAPRPGLSFYFRQPFRRIAGQAQRVHASLIERVHPVSALISLWEGLDPSDRVERTFCTNPSFYWSPNNKVDAAFDLTIGWAGAAAPDDGADRPLRGVNFGARGIVVAPEEKRDWHDTYDALTRILAGVKGPDGQLLRERPAIAAQLSPTTDATQAIALTLQSYEDSTGSTLSALWGVSRQRETIGEAFRAVVDLAVQRQYEKELAAAPEARRQDIVEFFLTEIAHRLSTIPAETSVRSVIDANLLFALSREGGESVIGALFAPPTERGLFANAEAEALLKRSLRSQPEKQKFGDGLDVFCGHLATALFVNEKRHAATEWAFYVASAAVMGRGDERALIGLAPVFDALAKLDDHVVAKSILGVWAQAAAAGLNARRRARWAAVAVAQSPFAQLPRAQIGTLPAISAMGQSHAVLGHQFDVRQRYISQLSVALKLCEVLAFPSD
jgi:hypothetical protein